MPRKDKKRDKRYVATAEEIIAQNKAIAEEEKKRKKEESAKQKKINEEYLSNREKNRAVFERNFKLSERKFIEKAKENGWYFKNSERKKGVIGDETALSNIYRVASNSGNPKLREICEKIISTPADTFEKRNSLMSEIKTGIEAVLKEGKIETLDKFKLVDVTEKAKGNFSEFEFSYVKDQIDAVRRKREEERLEKERHQTEKAAFSEQLLANGWSKKDEKMINAIFEIYYHEKVFLEKQGAGKDRETKISQQVEMMKNTTLDSKYPATHKQQLIAGFKSNVNKSFFVDLMGEFNSQESYLGTRDKAARNKEANEMALKGVKDAFADPQVIYGPAKKPSGRSFVSSLLDKDEKARDKEIEEKARREAAEKKVQAKKERLEKLQATDRKHVKDTKTLAGNLDKKIDKVDYFLFGQGSPEFDTMKKSIKDLTLFSREKYNAKQDNKLTTKEEAELLNRQYKAIRDIKGYLDHKKKDFEEDPARKNDAGNQKREQKRIVAAVDMLKDLEEAYAKNVKRLYEKEQAMRDKLKERLEAEAKVLEDPKTSQERYMQSLAIVTDMVNNLDGNKWFNPDPSRKEAFLETHMQDVKREYTNKYVKELIGAKEAPHLAPIKEGYKHIYGDVDDLKNSTDGKRLTLKDIYDIKMKTTPDYLMDVPMPKTMAGNAIQKEANQYGKDLFSVQTKTMTGRTDLYTKEDKDIVIKVVEGAQKKKKDTGAEFEKYNAAYQSVKQAKTLEKIEEGFRVEPAAVGKKAKDFSGRANVGDKLGMKDAKKGTKAKDDNTIVDQKTQIRKGPKM